MKKWFLDTWEWFKGFFSEETGSSTTRFLNWVWILFLCSNLTFIVLYNAIRTHEAKLPPIEATSGYITITGLLLAAKVGQKIWGENNPVTGGVVPAPSIVPTTITITTTDQSPIVVKS